MTKTYEIQCIWHTHDQLLMNEDVMGQWKGIMFCEESGHCYGLIFDKTCGNTNFAYSNYFVGHFKPKMGIAFMKVPLAQDIFPDVFTLAKDNKDGYCGEVAELSLDDKNLLDPTVYCGARVKVKEIELTPSEFNYYQKEVEKYQFCVTNYVSRVLLNAIEENSEFMMSGVKEMIKDNINYQNEKFML